MRGVSRAALLHALNERSRKSNAQKQATSNDNGQNRGFREALRPLTQREGGRKVCSTIALGHLVLSAVSMGLCVSCANDTFTSDGSGGMGTGGEGSGGSGSGGSSTGGSDGGGGTPIDRSCVVDGDCVAAVDMADPCFSPSCSGPVSASWTSVQSEVCLMLWSDRQEPRPEQCVSDEQVACPASCAQAPTCIQPFCSAGECQLDLGYSEDECGTVGATCEELDQDRKDTLQLARECDVGSLQCTGEDTVPGPCGCPIVVNETAAERVEQAQAAYDSWAEQCNPPDFCATTGCGPSDSGTCEASATNLSGMCRGQ